MRSAHADRALTGHRPRCRISSGAPVVGCTKPDVLSNAARSPLPVPPSRVHRGHDGLGANPDKPYCPRLIAATATTRARPSMTILVPEDRPAMTSDLSRSCRPRQALNTVDAGRAARQDDTRDSDGCDGGQLMRCADGGVWRADEASKKDTGNSVDPPVAETTLLQVQAQAKEFINALPAFLDGCAAVQSTAD